MRECSWRLVVAEADRPASEWVDWPLVSKMVCRWAGPAFVLFLCPFPCGQSRPAEGCNCKRFFKATRFEQQLPAIRWICRRHTAERTSLSCLLLLVLFSCPVRSPSAAQHTASSGTQTQHASLGVLYELVC